MKDKWVKAQKDQTVVLLDTELIPDLIHEGIANDIKRAIQILRKKCNYEINDHIMIWMWTDSIVDIESLCNKAKVIIPLPYTVDRATTYKSDHSLEIIRIAISKFSDYIRKETLCDKMYVLTNGVNFNCLKIAVERVRWTNKGDK